MLSFHLLPSWVLHSQILTFKDVVNWTANDHILKLDVKFCIQIGSDWPPNGTNVGLFKISFSTFWLGDPKCTETDLKKSQICPI